MKDCKNQMKPYKNEFPLEQIFLEEPLFEAHLPGIKEPVEVVTFKVISNQQAVTVNI